MGTLSIILLTWNSEQYVKNCLDSVLANTVGIDKEILVVDNGSTDQSVSLMEPYRKEGLIKLIQNKKNLGVAAGRNIGLRQATGDYLWLLDIDTVVNQEAIEGMLHFLQENDICGICGCKLHDKYGEVQDSCRRFPSFNYKMKNVLSSLLGRSRMMKGWKRMVDRSNESQYYHSQMMGETPFPVQYLIGACQLIRREVVEQVGLLDEQIFYGPEDADYCLRTSCKGWQIWYLPQVSFLHDYQRITNRKLFSRASFVHIKALFYYFRKHRKV